MFDIRLASLCHVCFPSSIRNALRFDVQLVALCHMSFPSSTYEGLLLDLRLVSLCHVCVPPSLQDRESERERLPDVSPKPQKWWTCNMKDPGKGLTSTKADIYIT
jgi:hypothetical protein